MAEARAFDVVVVGSGPGGEGAAMKASKAGKSVAVVERFLEVGGSCTHWTTIPSKALRQAIQRMADIRALAVRYPGVSHVEMEFPALVKAAEGVIRQQVTMRREFYGRNGVTVVAGQGAFADAHTLVVTDARGGQEQVRGKAFVLAPGARPYHPADVDFTHPRVLDVDSVLNMQVTPRSMTIYGAGIAGCEYASMFRAMGIKVNLVNTRDKLLSFLDDEIADALGYHLRDQGVVVRHGEEFEKVEPQEDGVVLHLKSGKRVRSDVLVWANGRTGNSDGMGLPGLGIQVNSRGQVEVNERYQTAQPHIYAVGDIVGYPSLASAAYDQGRFAATHIVDGKCELRLVRHVPVGIYTTPEISSVGLNERELTEKRVPYEVGHSLFRSLARAQILGAPVGMLKLLFHRETLQLLGIHCFGHQATEIIHIGQAIMSQEGAANSLHYFVNTTFNYPTMAEAYRVAALNGLNRV
jgi:NAD(P) transhydrogenase